MSSSDGLGGAAARCLGEPLILTGAPFSFGTAGLCLCWACRSSFIPGAMSHAAWFLASCVQAWLQGRGARGEGRWLLGHHLAGGRPHRLQWEWGREGSPPPGRGPRPLNSCVLLRPSASLAVPPRPGHPPPGGRHRGGSRAEGRGCVQALLQGPLAAWPLPGGRA